VGGRERVPVIYCAAGQRKHLIAGEYLQTHCPGVGVFLVLVAKAPAGAKALVFAEYHEDTSDLMTDYHGSVVTRTVAIGK